jgi:hypothetical protein
VLLWVLLLGLITLVVGAIVTREPGGNTQGEYYYFGLAALLAAGWILNQFGKLRARERRTRERRTPQGGGPVVPRIRRPHDSGPVPLEGGGGFVRSKGLTFEWGARAVAGADGGEGLDPPVPASTGEKRLTFGHGFEVPLASLPSDAAPDDATLDVIAAALERGETLEHLCEAAQPAYRGWSMWERRAYRFLIEAKLQERRPRGGGADG